MCARVCELGHRRAYAVCRVWEKQGAHSWDMYEPHPCRPSRRASLSEPPASRALAMLFRQCSRA